MNGSMFTKQGSRGNSRFRGPVIKPKHFKETMKRLQQYFAGEQRALMGIGMAIALSGGIHILIPYAIGKVIDSLSVKEGYVDLGFLQIMMVVLIAAYGIDAFVTLMQGWVMAGVSKRIVIQLRSHLFSKLQKLPINFFDTHTHGEVMSHLTNDIENVSTTISQSAAQLMAGLINIAGALLMMILLSPRLTAASLVTVPLVLLLSKTIAIKTKVYFKHQQRELGRLNGYIEEAITGIHVIKAFNHEEKVIKDFSAINNQLFEVGLKAQIWSGFLMPLMNVIGNLGFAAIAGIGGVLAAKDLISIGVIASFLSYSKQFIKPLNEIANVFNTLQSAVASAERVFEILDEEEETKDKKDALTLRHPRGDVCFKEVSFGYRADVPVLKKVSFEAMKGSSIALVGTTGSGKTTIVNLLTRFYDVTEGQILIDGRDIREYTRNSLRKCFGVVLQDTYLFTGSIYENIRYGNLDASDEEVKAAAKMSNAHDFIKRMPKGYDTVLTESGKSLSAGERQLLAIARAILRDTPILILDEATSSVDTRTEFHIQEAMLKLMKGRTSFIIAHRLSTIKDVERIMLIEEGEVAEAGSHKELMALQGKYYALYQTLVTNME
ncbi:MAG: multidrug transporter ATP-binding protein [Clostridia bacterium]|nr:multidrug transporter ATP-binding protein [Clostridia bacterium]